MKSSPYAEDILRSIRRITRAIDLHSRELDSRFHLTVPQLVLIQQLASNGPSSPSQLSRQVFLSQATVTGILNRLESRGLIQRERIHSDRRLVTLTLTDHGRVVVENSPPPLQKLFSERLEALPHQDQERISRILHLVVEMMEAHELDAEPCMVAEK